MLFSILLYNCYSSEFSSWFKGGPSTEPNATSLSSGSTISLSGISSSITALPAFLALITPSSTEIIELSELDQSKFLSFASSGVILAVISLESPTVSVIDV